MSRGAVQVGVSRLRAWLRDTAGPDAAASIAHVGDGYRLTTRPDAVDLRRLRTLLATAEGTADPLQRYGVLESTMRLRRGAVLADLTAVDMSDALFRSAEEAVRACALAFAAAALAVERPAQAVALLEALAEDAPFDEPVHACLIELLAAAGQPAAALAHHERLRRRLADEFGDRGEVRRGPGARRAGVGRGRLGRIAEARTSAQQAVALAREVGYRLLEDQAVAALDGLDAAVPDA